MSPARSRTEDRGVVHVVRRLHASSLARRVLPVAGDRAPRSSSSSFRGSTAYSMVSLTVPRRCCHGGAARRRRAASLVALMSRDRQVAAALTLASVDGEIGHAVHRLSVRRGDHVGHNTPIDIGTLQSRHGRGRLRQRSHDAMPSMFRRICRLAFARRDDSDSRDRHTTGANESGRNSVHHVHGDGESNSGGCSGARNDCAVDAGEAAALSSKGPPELPGLIGASVWITLRLHEKRRSAGVGAAR